MTRGYWITAIILTGLAWCLSIGVYPALPSRIPTHWNFQGEVDGWGDKTWATFLVPGMMVGMLVLFAFLPALSPRHFEVTTFRSTYLYIMVLTTAMFLYVHAVILLATWQEVRGGPKLFDLGRALIGGIFLFLALLGNVLGKVRRNFYIGIRVPWTLASDRVWNDTHRLAAWLLVVAGLAGCLLVLAGGNLALALGLLISAFLIPIVYSFIHYKSLERSGAL